MTRRKQRAAAVWFLRRPGIGEPMKRLAIASVWLFALLAPSAPPVVSTTIQLRAGETVTASELRRPEVRFAIAWVVKIEALNKKHPWAECVYPAWQQVKARYRKGQYGALAMEWLERKWINGPGLTFWRFAHRDREAEILRG